ncbi:transcription elongation factor GreA [Microvirga thermotolerans]|uniref:Transcription elongation factor GreA n=1 Tax=Microvirga thermotolerans TaxID=2651334 RepID=A0A5P9JU32_9HYPH|nr:transcription elongation factor GreA [Microvirga thermotolerans]QFU16117.1 transcription elongation factor GreA [Microvirga thermotolerans]
MSRAFVREDDRGEAFEDLPDRPISPHQNLVTPAGLAQIDAMVADLQHRLAQAQEAEDKGEIARVARDLRYWSHRKSTAELVPEPTDFSHVRFGSRVTFVRDDGRTQTYRIVGEDEADPAKGSISYVSPLAQALLGKQVGDAVSVAHTEAEIVRIE